MKFTRDNAAMMARRSHNARYSAVNARILASAPPVKDAQDERRKRIGAQIDIIDADIARTKKPDLRCKLIAAKAKLWNLLYPVETRNGKPQDRMPIMLPVVPLPIVNPAPIVAPIIEPNHNGEIVQSQVVA